MAAGGLFGVSDIAIKHLVHPALTPCHAACQPVDAVGARRDGDRFLRLGAKPAAEAGDRGDHIHSTPFNLGISQAATIAVLRASDVDADNGLSYGILPWRSRSLLRLCWACPPCSTADLPDRRPPLLDPATAARKQANDLSRHGSGG
jgi:hypothetical protein